MNTDEYKKNECIDQTRKWIERMVIGLGLCPFAAKPYFDQRVLVKYVESVDFIKDVEACMSEVDVLVHTPNDKVSNVLLIYPFYDDNFEDFLDLFYACEEELISSEWVGQVQLTSFHPNYLFNESQVEDMANYTNRSPHALIHLLRTEEVAEAIESYDDTRLIYERNIKLLRKLGLKGIQDYLKH